MSNRLLNGLRGLFIVGLVLLMAATSSGALEQPRPHGDVERKLATAASERLASAFTVYDRHRRQRLGQQRLARQQRLGQQRQLRLGKLRQLGQQRLG